MTSSLAEITAAKQRLGYSSDHSTVFYATISDIKATKRTLFIAPAFAALTDALTGNYYFGSFEQTGILLLTATARFAIAEGKQPVLIPYTAIQAVTFAKPHGTLAFVGKGNLNCETLTITTADGQSQLLSVYKQMGMTKSYAWVRENYLRIKDIVDQGRLPLGEAATQTDQSAASSPEPPVNHESPKFCANCGKPLEPNQRFCPHCGQKIQP